MEAGFHLGIKKKKSQKSEIKYCNYPFNFLFHGGNWLSYKTLYKCSFNVVHLHYLNASVMDSYWPTGCGLLSSALRSGRLARLPRWKTRRCPLRPPRPQCWIPNLWNPCAAGSSAVPCQAERQCQRSGWTRITTAAGRGRKTDMYVQ